MAADSSDEREDRIWRRIESQVEFARPRWLAPAMTPFSPWLLIGSVVFVPAMLALSFFVRRHVIALTGTDLIVYDVSFWRLRVEREVERLRLGEGSVSLDGGRLTIGDRRYYLEPGWGDVGRRLVELDRAAPG